MILVTGGTGLLGNNIIRKLLEDGRRVRALVRSTADGRPFENLDVEIVQGELSDPSALAAAAKGCSAVIHAAAMIHLGWEKQSESHEVNVVGTSNLAKVCIDVGARLVYVSTVNTLNAATAVDQPLDESNQGGVPLAECAYVVSKTNAERAVLEMVENDGLNAVIVKPGFMLGPYDWKPSSGRMMLEVAKAPLVAAPPGGCSVCDVRDVSAGAVAAIEKGQPGESFILAGENISYADFWRKLRQVAGKSTFVYRLKPRVQLLGKAIDAFRKVIPIREGDVNGASIQLGCLFHCYDSSKARQQLGYANRPLDETLECSWEWLAEHHLRSRK